MFRINLIIKTYAFIFLTMTMVSAKSVQTLQIGANCSDSNGKLGTCEKLSNCPTVASQKSITICMFSRSEPILCCVKLENLPESTTQTAENIENRNAKLKSSLPIHVQKCQEYGQAVYKLQRPAILVPGAPMQNVSLCSRKMKPVIVGGVEADPGEYPHMALIGVKLGDEMSWNCGGTLISENFVLTAAHCTFDPGLGDANSVRLGDLNVAETADLARPQDFTITEIINHPNYTGIAQYNDIALLKLDRNATFDEYVRPACLSNRQKIIATQAIATGWGTIGAEMTENNDHLLEVTLDMATQERCNAKYQNKLAKRKLPLGVLPETQICAGGSGKEMDTCSGDSGGPLQIDNDGVYCMFDIIGITSLGTSCGSRDTPSIYTRVSAFIPWIEKHVWKS